MAERLPRPAWWEGDFDTTGKTQLGWALEAAAAYRVAHPEEFGGVTPPSVTPPKGAERVRRWRAKRKAVLAQG